MSNKLVVGQIGCGAFARDQHGPNCRANKHVTGIKWACDTSPENARTYAREFGVDKVTGSFEDVTTDPEVDLICIATSHEAHVPIIESAAEHGKHVFCEKPMALDEQQAYRIIRAVRRARVKLCVDYMRRLAPATRALKHEWLAHKANPQRQPWRYIEKPRERLAEEKATDFMVRVQDESSSYRTVHLDPFRGGGLIIGEATHWLDLACWLYDDDRPVEILAWGSARMRYGIHLAFQSGNEATIVMTPNGTFDYPKEIFEIACDGALFRMENYLENQYYGRPGTMREVFHLHRDAAPQVGTQGGLGGYLDKYRANVSSATNSKHVREGLAPDLGWQKMFDAFVDSIVRNSATPCDELAGYHATLLGELAIKSLQLGRPLAVPVDKWNYYVEL